MFKNLMIGAAIAVTALSAPLAASAQSWGGDRDRDGRYERNERRADRNRHDGGCSQFQIHHQTYPPMSHGYVRGAGAVGGEVIPSPQSSGTSPPRRHHSQERPAFFVRPFTHRLYTRVLHRLCIPCQPPLLKMPQATSSITSRPGGTPNCHPSLAARRSTRGQLLENPRQKIVQRPASAGPSHSSVQSAPPRAVRFSLVSLTLAWVLR